MASNVADGGAAFTLLLPAARSGCLKTPALNAECRMPNAECRMPNAKNALLSAFGI